MIDLADMVIIAAFSFSHNNFIIQNAYNLLYIVHTM